MKTRSAAFDIAWTRKRARKAVFKIVYQRRYWNGTAYVLEATPITLNQRDIYRVSGLNWKFDLPLKNEIGAGNVTIQLKDKLYKWLPANTVSSVWKADATATSGYEPQQSQFQIQYGYILDDGTQELLKVFTGLLVDDPKFDSKTGVVTLPLMSVGESKLRNSDATKVTLSGAAATTSPANGDGVNKTFDTQLKSVWQATNVKDNGALKTQGSTADYTLSQLNDAENDGQIVFVTAPAAGHPILFDYKQWYRNQTIAALVGLLCDNAGITAGNRYIEEPVFQGVDSHVTEDSQSDFQAGTLTNVDAVLLPGKIYGPWTLFDDFRDGLLSGRTTPGAPTWSNIAQSGSSSIIVIGQQCYVALGSFNGYIHNRAPFTLATGSYKQNVLIRSANNNLAGSGVYWLFVCIASTSSNILTGYGLRWNANNQHVELVYWNAEDSAAGTILATLATTLDIGISHSWRVTRDGSGNMNVYRDGTLVGTVTENSITTNSYMVLGGKISQTGNPPEATAYFDDIYFSTQTSGPYTGTWVSPEMDLFATPTVWLPMVITAQANDGGYAIKTRVASVSGGPYDADAALDGSNTPTSALKRFVKIVVAFSDTANSISTLQAVIDVLTLNWRNSTLVIASADFTGMTGLDVVKELGRIGNMEYGTDGSGKFFFRNKAVTATPVLKINQSNAIVSIDDWTPGYRGVHNVAQVQYGLSGARQQGYYFQQWRDTDAGEAAPTTAQRFGDRVMQFDLTRWVFSNGANVAKAVAQNIYNANYRPKRTLQITARIIPHLDLSDVIQVDFYDSPLIQSQIFGDPLQKADRMPPIGGNTRTLARGLVLKVISHSPDIFKGTSQIIAEEILS